MVVPERISSSNSSLWNGLISIFFHHEVGRVSHTSFALGLDPGPSPRGVADLRPALIIESVRLCEDSG